MKRNIFCLLLLGMFVCFSCSNLLQDIPQNKNNKYGLINISLDKDTNQRTILPDLDKTMLNLSNIKLYAKTSSSKTSIENKDNCIASWKTYEEMNKNPIAIKMLANTYDFMLCVDSCGITLKQEILNTVVTTNEVTKLTFSELKAKSLNNQTGSMTISVNQSLFKSGSTVSVQIDKGEPISLELYYDSKKTKGSEKLESMYCDKITYTNACVTAGNHDLVFTFTDSDGQSLIYPIVLQIETGVWSTKTLTISSQSFYSEAKTGCKVTYNANLEVNSPSVVKNFYKGVSICDVKDLGFSNGTKRLDYWSTNKDGTGTKYSPGEMPTLSEDITLYAQWADYTVVTYYLNQSDSDKTYKTRYENGVCTLLNKDGIKSNFYGVVDYLFCGWDTKPDGTGTRYQDGTTLTFTSDKVLYAQWCSKSSSTYDCIVKNVKEWNAFFGAPWLCQTDGIITSKVSVTGNIVNPNANLTKDLTFAGKLDGNYSQPKITGITEPLFYEVATDAEVTKITLLEPVCYVNYGTISKCTVSNPSHELTSNGYYGAITAENYGTISNCNVSMDGFLDFGFYTSGGIAGYNEGSISDCDVSGYMSIDYCKDFGGIVGYNAGTITNCDASASIYIEGCDNAGCIASKNETTGIISNCNVSGTLNIDSCFYAGGIVGYNQGKINGTGTVVGTVDLYLIVKDSIAYGYVIGLNDGGTIAKNITVAQSEYLIEKTSHSVPSESYRTIKFETDRTAKITLMLHDYSGGSAIYGTIWKNNPEGTTGFVIQTGKVNAETVNITTAYLPAGSYFLELRNDNILSSSSGYYSIKID